eukprot:tig00020965_g16841.t1
MTGQSELRAEIRAGRHQRPTSGLVPGTLQTNVVILPKAVAKDFLEFCRLNYAACPLVDLCPPGQYEPARICPGGDVRTDIPKYYVYRNGELAEERTDIADLWRDDFVSFFLGCSFSFERALQAGGVPVRNIDEGKNVSMYRTSKPCASAGPFHCNLVVTMRPVAPEKVEAATRITTELSSAHGGPVHVGSPAEIGIQDLAKVDFGDAVTVRPGEVPVFWCCGVTAIVGAISAKTDICITHKPGHMFISAVGEDYVPKDLPTL